MRRWLKAGALEDGVHQPSEEGTPQGGSISVLLSNVYLHYVLDLWFERVVKPRLQGEAYMVRYLDDFVVCFSVPSRCITCPGCPAQAVGEVQSDAGTEQNETGRVWPVRRKARTETREKTTGDDLLRRLHPVLHRNRGGGYKVGIRTEKSRVRRTLATLRDLMRRMRHLPVREQALNLNRLLQGHYAYFGVAGNFRALQRIGHAVERYWRKMLSSRVARGTSLGTSFTRYRRGTRYSDHVYVSRIGSCKHSLRCESVCEERSAGNPHAPFCGSRRRVTASGDPVAPGNRRPYRDRNLGNRTVL